jgi:flagellin
LSICPAREALIKGTNNGQFAAFLGPGEKMSQGDWVGVDKCFNWQRCRGQYPIQQEFSMTTINTNAISLNAQRNLYSNSSSLATTIQRLSSGLRVNSAKDDAAGIAVAERMTSQIRGSQMAIRNAMDGISMFQTAEGAMSRVADNVQRIRELAVQAGNDTFSEEDRANLQLEVDQLTTEIERVVTTARFNGITLLDGAGGVTTLQIGANALVGGAAVADELDVTAAFTDFDLSALTATGGAGTIDITGADGSLARGVLEGLDDDLVLINTARATAGAFQSSLENIVSQLQVYSENMSTSRGRIMDADFASETANLTRTQILQQAGTAMVAQANQLPQGVLALLR